MRGAIPGLRSPHPLETFLPDVYFEDALPSAGAGDAFPPGTYVAVIGERDLEGVAGIPGPALRSLVGEWLLAVSVERGVNAPFALTLRCDGEVVARGTLESSGDAITVHTADCGPADGKYRWKFDGETLSLTVVEDSCSPRNVILTTRVWQRRNFVVRFLSAFDEVLAPVFVTLDNLDAYVDVRLTPGDFVDWLSGWVDLIPNHAWPVPRRRERIARAARLVRSWGTAQGIRDYIAAFAGVDPSNVEIVENGGVAYSPTPGGELPGRPEPHLKVRVAVPDPSQVDVGLLEQNVAGAKPAHVLHEVEVVKQ
jgi:phage tail-like protein